MSAAEEMLTTASALLRQSGFAVMKEHLHGASAGWVLAESDLFIVAVVAAEDLRDLREVESFAAPELIQRIEQADGVGGKRWDAYLVLLASRDAKAHEDARELVTIGYDTRGMRRMVAVGVEPTKTNISNVLRPFLPLPEPPSGGLSDAFRDLSEQLILNGIDDEDARRVVAAFQDRGHLNDV